MTANLHRVFFLVLILALGIFVQVPAFARDIVSTSFSTQNVDLIDVIERLKTENPEVQIELPTDSSGTTSKMTAVAVGTGTTHQWGVFSLRNQDPVPRDLVLTARHRGFVGSRLLWPNFSVQQILSVQSSPGLQPLKLISANMDAFHFRINPGETITYAIEWANGTPASLTLWQRTAYDVNLQKTSTFYGMLLGFSILLLIAIICLFVIRPQMVFPSGILFVGASLVFLAGEFGYLDGVAISFPGVPDLAARLQAMSEALMAAGLIACFITFVELRMRVPPAWYGAAVGLVVAFALAAWAWFDPARAAAGARITFLFASVTGLASVLGLVYAGVIRAKASLIFFASVFVWTLIAIAAIFDFFDPGLLQLAVICGLILVMAIATLTLGRFAINQGVIHSKFFEDSGRRALALAGSEQCVWDWNEERSHLHVGPELERALGYSPGKISKGGLKAWLGIIHPADRPSYLSGIEASIRRGKGVLRQQFRLRKSDETYRWYELRGRALPGEQDHASRCIGTLCDITTSKRAEDSLLFDAVHDRITRLPNRALFLDRLERAMRRGLDAEDSKIAVVVVDLDRFKNVNDGLGHPVGDSLLLTMARRLREFVGPDDTLARIAGDQFGLIINAANPERDIAEFANTIREALAQPIEIKSREVILTACLGIAEFNRNTEVPEELLKDAEIALFEAKRKGKNIIEVFNPEMRNDRSELVHLETELRGALERNEIEVMFQPITRIEDLELAGFEALVRWRHRQRGLLAPDEFLDMAEETGLISEMGEFVLNEAALQLGIWQRAFRPEQPLFVAINLSHSQVLGRGLVDEVAAVLGREDLAPGTLKIEITESMVMENPELSVQILDRLKRLGVGLSCDDFGTGYSSLAMLERLPFDTLKLDKAFLEPDPESDTAAIILEAVINLAHDLDLVVVAEGVENKEQVERLRELECDLAQGFHFGEPMTARKVIETLGGSPFLLSRQGGNERSGFLKRVFDGRRNRDPDANVFVTKPTIAAGGNVAPAPSRSRVPPAEANRTTPVRSPLADGQLHPTEAVEPEIVSGDGAANPPLRVPPPVANVPRMGMPVPGSLPESHVHEREEEPATAPSFPAPAPAPIAAEPEVPKDDLQLIAGVGDTIHHVLDEMGITTFTQIAELSDEEAERINTRIGFPGRVQSDLWAEQARQLASGEPAWSMDHFATTKDRVAAERAPIEAVVEEEVPEVLEVLPRIPIPSRIAASTLDEDAVADDDEPDLEAEPEQDAAPEIEADSDVEEEVEADAEIDPALETKIDAEPEGEVEPVGEVEPEVEAEAEEELDIAEEQPVANDLTKIRGIGPAIRRDLNDLNIIGYRQLAELDDGQIDEINERIGFPGRVQREKWREQAAAFLDGNDLETTPSKNAGDGMNDEDDVSLISGIGPAIARDLTEMGIVTFAQISELNDQEMRAINDKIGFPGRVEREQWREQARELMAGVAPRAKVDRDALVEAEETDETGEPDGSDTA